MFDNHYKVAKFYTTDRPPDHPGNPGFLEDQLEQADADDQALIKKFAREAQQEQRKLWDYEDQSMARR